MEREERERLEALKRKTSGQLFKEKMFSKDNI